MNTTRTLRTSPTARDLAITALARLYVEAGLPLPAAYRAALADYAGFEEAEPEQTLCAA